MLLLERRLWHFVEDGMINSLYEVINESIKYCTASNNGFMSVTKYITKNVLLADANEQWHYVIKRYSCIRDILAYYRIVHLAGFLS